MTDAIDNTDIMVLLRASEAEWISMGAADDSEQFKASFKLSVMQRAAMIVPEIWDDLVQFLELLFQTANTIANKISYKQLNCTYFLE